MVITIKADEQYWVEFLKNTIVKDEKLKIIHYLLFASCIVFVVSNWGSLEAFDFEIILAMLVVIHDVVAYNMIVRQDKVPKIFELSLSKRLKIKCKDVYKVTICYKFDVLNEEIKVTNLYTKKSVLIKDIIILDNYIINKNRLFISKNKTSEHEFESLKKMLEENIPKGKITYNR